MMRHARQPRKTDDKSRRGQAIEALLGSASALASACSRNAFLRCIRALASGKWLRPAPRPLRQVQ